MALFDLTGKRILVTGASSGIGQSCAILAAGLGASVILTARRRDALVETLGLMNASDEHLIIDGDLANPEFVSQLVERAGKMDGLVHAAGVCPALPIGMVKDDSLLDSMQTNYFAFINLMKLYSKRKYANEGFSAVAVSSVSAEVGWPGGVLYSGSKGALSASVRALALELAPKKMRVNAVCPSNIKTAILERLIGNDVDALSRVAARQPLGVGLPIQVAAPICFLLSDAASFITGTNLPVDGGYLAM